MFIHVNILTNQSLGCNDYSTPKMKDCLVQSKNV